MNQMLPSHRSNIQKNNDSAMLNLWLSRTHDARGLSDWKVDRVVVTTNTFVNAISVKSKKSFNTILAQEFIDAITGYLPMTLKEHVLTASDLVFETKGLTLQCLRVTGQKLSDGVQRVMLTFRRALGSVANLFQPDSLPCLMKEAQAGLSTRVLEEILSPVLNLTELTSYQGCKDFEASVANILERLRQRKQDLQFYANLITRYVEQLDGPDTVALSKASNAPYRQGNEGFQI